MMKDFVKGASAVWFLDQSEIEARRRLLNLRLQEEEFDGQWPNSMEEWAASLDKADRGVGGSEQGAGV